MVDKWEYYASNDTLHNCFRGGNREKNANEGSFSHLLPLKEGGEETPLIFIFLFIFPPNQTSFENMCHTLSIDIFPILYNHTQSSAQHNRHADLYTHLEHIRSIDVPRCAEQSFEPWPLCDAHQAMRVGSFTSTEEGELNKYLFQIFCQPHTKFEQIFVFLSLCKPKNTTMNRSDWTSCMVGQYF